MRSLQEQLAGLNKVAQLVALAGCNCTIVHRSNDVAFCAACSYFGGTKGMSQIVYVSGGYDVWESCSGGLNQTDLSARAAADVIIREYQARKLEGVRRRIEGANAE